MGFIKELYKGNISPWEKAFVRSSRYDREAAVSVKSENYLRKSLKDDDLKNFERFINSTNEILDISCQEYFEIGFRLGVELMADVFCGEDKGMLRDIED